MSEKVKVILIIAISAVISFFLTAALCYGVFWAFHLQWSWKISFGVWLCALAINAMIKRNNRE